MSAIQMAFLPVHHQISGCGSPLQQAAAALGVSETVVRRRFPCKFVAGLRRAFRNHQLGFYGECRPLAVEKNFVAFLRTLFQQDWIVYAKPPFGGPEHVLHYLARYTHRVAISNHLRAWPQYGRA